jgi:hypothetical protein
VPLCEQQQNSFVCRSAHARPRSLHWLVSIQQSEGAGAPRRFLFHSLLGGPNPHAFKPSYRVPTARTLAMDAMDVDAGATAAAAPAAPAPADASPAAHLYVVTAHKPSAVGHALVGAFTGPSDVNLIIS